MSVKNIVVLGSTGSIGKQTLDIVRHFPEKFRIIGLAAGQSSELLASQVEEFRPQYVFSKDESFPLKNLKAKPRLTTMEEMVSASETELIMAGTVGAAGLSPILAALRHGKVVALANKEPIIMAGGHLMAEAKRNHGQILPVDSEPSAIWQCLRGETSPVKRIILTASGGPFRSAQLESLKNVSPEEALHHPTWRMGKKITIDSATLMNKGLEVIEAHWLFDMPFKQIDVVIHPQSIIHSMVEFYDSSVKAQLGIPDMRVPIQLAMTYPERWENSDLPSVDFVKAGKLTFEPMDVDRYPCFKLALNAGAKAQTYPAVLAAADETAVGLFLKKRIGFMDIPSLVESALSAHNPVKDPGLEDILQADSWAREFTSNKVPV